MRVAVSMIAVMIAVLLGVMLAVMIDVLLDVMIAVRQTKPCTLIHPIHQVYAAAAGLHT